METTQQYPQQTRMFSAIDWASYYGIVKLSPQVEEILRDVCPFNKGKLIRETHFVFLGMPAIDGIPLTVMRWTELHPTGQPKFCFNTDMWHAGQPHTDVATLKPHCLYLVLREIVPGSEGRIPEEHVMMMPPEYEVPSTITEVTKNILVFRRTGKFSNPGCWAACRERTVKTTLINAGLISCVGGFNEDGLRVEYWSGERMRRVGVGACRKILL